MSQGYHKGSPFRNPRPRRGRGGGPRMRQRQSSTQQTLTNAQRKQKKQQETNQFKQDIAQYRYANTQTPPKNSKKPNTSYRNVVNQNRNTNNNNNRNNTNNRNLNPNQPTSNSTKIPKFKPTTDIISSQILGYESDDPVFDVDVRTSDKNKNQNEDSKMESLDVVTTSKNHNSNNNNNNNKNKNKSPSKMNHLSNIDKRSLSFDRATESWYDKKDKHYQIKKLFNQIAVNVHNNKNNLPRIIIKNIDITEWSYHNVHEELEKLINDFNDAGNDHWKQLTSEVLIDYKIHTPKRDNNDNNENNNIEEYEVKQELKQDWFKELLEKANSANKKQQPEKKNESKIEIELDNNESGSNNNNNNDIEDNTYIDGRLNGKEYKRRHHKQWDGDPIKDARDSHPASLFTENTRIDAQMTMYSNWNPRVLLNIHTMNERIKHFDISTLTKVKMMTLLGNNSNVQLLIQGMFVNA